ncbi:MAG: hypothetical protein KDI07_24710 [Anaerolineae bacterium]|nr:hypothetical protein [Anaerolineae bacterium]MCB0251793.1 hypothetical protein [Anaerolineae bacterium]
MTDETRQPLTGDVVLAQIMEKTGADTPTDALHRVFELEDKVHFYEDAPKPLLTVDYQGRITVRKDVTVYGLTQIIEAIKNMTIAGS